MQQAVLETGMDRYVISEHLAEGGMGAIYLGKKVGVGGSEKEVVLKQLLPEFTAHTEFIGLFLREAKLSAALDHVNIVRTLDLVTSGNDYFMVMEYVRGGDLRAVLRKVKRRHTRLSAAASLLIAREMLSALNYAHGRKSEHGQPLKLIHRDISPSNVMLSLSGEVKLTDFGIAKVSTHKSVFYRVKGKAGYMSPEQAYGEQPIDHRSDLYSLGVCLYEMLAGERLFVADLISPPNLVYSQPLPKLEGLPEMPPGIDAVLARILDLDPDARYQTAADFQEALIQVAYDNNLLFNTADLSQELRLKCGDTPDDWRREVDPDFVPPPTEAFSESVSTAFSGVELTSVLNPVLEAPGEPTRTAPLAPPPSEPGAGRPSFEQPTVSAPNSFQEEGETLTFIPVGQGSPRTQAEAAGQIAGDQLRRDGTGEAAPRSADLHSQETLMLAAIDQAPATPQDSGLPRPPSPPPSRPAHRHRAPRPTLSTDALRDRAMLLASAALLLASALLLALASLL